MQLKILKLAFDIKESIAAIKQYMKAIDSFEAYTSNRMLRRAVERELEIIGEAVNNLRKINPTITISNKRQIVALRNWIIHAYDQVDDRVVWDTVTNDLAILKAEIELLEKSYR